MRAVFQVIVTLLVTSGCGGAEAPPTASDAAADVVMRAQPPRPKGWSDAAAQANARVALAFVAAANEDRVADMLPLVRDARVGTDIGPALRRDVAHVLANDNQVVIFGRERGRVGDVSYVTPTVDFVTIEAGKITDFETLRDEGLRQAQLTRNGYPLPPDLAAAAPPAPATTFGADDATMVDQVRAYFGSGSRGPKALGLQADASIGTERVWVFGSWAVARLELAPDEWFGERSGRAAVVLIQLDGLDVGAARFVLAPTPRLRGRVQPSPDGAHIAYAVDYGGPLADIGRDGVPPGDVVVALPDGTNARSLTSSGVARAPEWLPGGELVFEEEQDIMIAEGPDFQVRPLVAGERGEEGCDDGDPCRFLGRSPDGRFAAAACRRDSISGPFVVFSTFASGETIAREPVDAAGIDWPKVGVRLERAAREPRSAPRPPDGVRWIDELAPSPDGRLLAATGLRDARWYMRGHRRDRDIYLYDLAAATWRQVSRNGTAEHPTWSPDGKLLAYVARAEIAVHDVAADATLATREVLRDVLGPPVWSSDGRFLAAIGHDADSPASRASLRFDLVTRDVLENELDLETACARIRPSFDADHNVVVLP